MIINGGFRKKELINSLNNKKYLELSENLKSFVKKIFPNIKQTDIIVCKKYNGINVNMSLSIHDVTKYISIKTGSSSIVFKGNIYYFLSKLFMFDVSNKSIFSILKYYRREIGKREDSSFGSKLKEDFKKEIEIVRDEFDNPEILSNLIDFVFDEEKKDVKIDYFYYGNVQIGFVISSNKLKEKLLYENDNYPHEFMRIGPFNFLSLTKNIKTGFGNECQLRINNIYKFFK